MLISQHTDKPAVSETRTSSQSGRRLQLVWLAVAAATLMGLWNAYPASEKSPAPLATRAHYFMAHLYGMGKVFARR